MEVELMVTKRDDNRQPTTDDDDRVNIEQSASGRWTGRVLQFQNMKRKKDGACKFQTAPYQLLWVDSKSKEQTFEESDSNLFFFALN